MGVLFSSFMGVLFSFSFFPSFSLGVLFSSFFPFLFFPPFLWVSFFLFLFSFGKFVGVLFSVFSVLFSFDHTAAHCGAI